MDWRAIQVKWIHLILSHTLRESEKKSESVWESCLVGAVGVVVAVVIAAYSCRQGGFQRSNGNEFTAIACKIKCDVINWRNIVATH